MKNELRIVVDTREQDTLEFTLPTEKRTLTTGDYSIKGLERYVKMKNLVKVETNEVSILSLKNKLDEIDKTVYQLAYDGFYGSRLAILMGMWRKGKEIRTYRGVDVPKSFYELEKETGFAHQHLKRWNDLYEKYPNREDYQKLAEELAAAWTKKAFKSSVHFLSDSGDWNTPPEVIERVVKLFGSIDLDPCAESAENPNVPAETHFTIKDNGLKQRWYGRVYMNPPYGSTISEWVEKLCQEYKCGNVKQAIALVPARTDTEWWGKLKDCAVCFIDGRLKFSGHDNSAPFPSHVAYFGTNVESFANAFGDMGKIWVEWRSNSQLPPAEAGKERLKCLTKT